MLDFIPPELRSRIRQIQQPRWVEPMLATRTEKRFSDPDWLFEPKLDGERCLAFRDGSSLRLMSRNKRELNTSYPEIVEALRHQANTDFILDGEVVAFEDERTSFARLQRRMQLRDSEAARKTGIEVFYYVFDLLYLDGYALDALPLRQRKNLLEKALSFGGPLSFSAHRDMDGEAYYAEACAKGWEGVIAKRADSAYVHHRSADWLKFKCSNEQELVIGGFTDPRGSRIGFGALLTGYYKNGRLQYAGKVGTGYNTQTLMDLRKQLRALEQHRSPFVQRISEHGVHWVRPELVAQIAFAEWTRDGRLRQARFRGLRRDKTPHSVVREGVA